MADISKAQKARAEQSLKKLIKHDGVIMTRQEWCDKILSEGYFPREGTRNRIRYNQTYSNRLMSNKEQEEYQKKCDEIIPCYKAVNKENSFYEISKAEFDYMNSQIEKYSTLSFKSIEIASKNKEDIESHFSNRLIYSYIKEGVDERGNEGFQVYYGFMKNN